MTHSRRQQMTSNVFADATHMLGLVKYTPPVLSIKNSKNMKILKCPT
jgi:hypothetical protein